MKLEIYTDGSARNNGTKISVGGWAYQGYLDGVEVLSFCDSGATADATNQQMELTAAIMACKKAEEFIKNYNTDIPWEIYIYSDSAYLINCKEQMWYAAWLSNGWRNAKKQPVANKEYWEELLPFFRQNNYFFVKVKGHRGHEQNDKVDRMAQSASAALNYEVNKKGKKI